MHLVSDKLNQKTKEWEKTVSQYHHPRWSELPMLDLYMDQVIVLVNQYLDIFTKLSGDEKTVTAPMINNYVKLKTIPAPVKKKYSRRHLAFIIMVCTLKQCHSMSTIQRLLPLDISDRKLESLFDAFAANHEETFRKVSDTVLQSLKAVGRTEADLELQRLFTDSAIQSNILKSLTEYIAKILLDVDAD